MTPLIFVNLTSRSQAYHSTLWCCDDLPWLWCLPSSYTWLLGFKSYDGVTCKASLGGWTFHRCMKCYKSRWWPQWAQAHAHGTSATLGQWQKMDQLALTKHISSQRIKIELTLRWYSTDIIHFVTISSTWIKHRIFRWKKNPKFGAVPDNQICQVHGGLSLAAAAGPLQWLGFVRQSLLASLPRFGWFGKAV